MKLKASLTKKFYIVLDWQKQHKEKVPQFKRGGDTAPSLKQSKALFIYSTHLSENTNEQSQTDSLPLIFATPQNSLPFFPEESIGLCKQWLWQEDPDVCSVLMAVVKSPLPVSKEQSLIARC